MDIPTLIAFFKWCTIINASILIIWTLLWILMPEFIYRAQSRFCPMSRETFNVVTYCMLGGLKLAVLIFNAAPLAALIIINCGCGS